MQKTHDTTLIIAVVVILMFLIFTAIYFFSSNKLAGEENNLDNNLYTPNEHAHMINIYTENSYEIKEYTKLSSYTTKIYDKDKNRIHNIKLACKKLDGHIVAPGDEFSFNNTLGKMGEADGYKKALGFDSNGNKIKVYGGGLCQISSTLYNSVLIAKLEVTERHAHSRRVNYVPENKDATIFYGGPDFKFINSTDKNIMICTSTDGYKVTVTLKEENIVKK